MRLDVVVAGGNVRQVRERGAEVGIVDGRGVAGLKGIDIAAEEGNTDAADLQAGLTGFCGGGDCIGGTAVR